ncbi:hypothetical protein EDC04DRAFT_2684211 [Pisolithus marmoratus]|nr:hypothetical protein EDC04DRAFT_2684211 [Pisolithus marmoratus]
MIAQLAISELFFSLVTFILLTLATISLPTASGWYGYRSHRCRRWHSTTCQYPYNVMSLLYNHSVYGMCFALCV